MTPHDATAGSLPPVPAAATVRPLLSPVLPSPVLPSPVLPSPVLPGPPRRTPSSSWLDAVTGDRSGGAVADGHAAVASLGACLAVAAGSTGEILLGGPSGAPRSLGRHGARVTTLLAHEGLLFSAGCDGRVLGWAPGTAGGLCVVVACHDTGVTAAQAGPDGRLLTAGHDGRVLAWHEGEPSLVALHRGGVEALAVVAGGDLVTAGRDGRLLLHAGRPGAPVELRLRRRELSVAMAALPGIGLLTAGGHRGVLRLWDDLAVDARPEEVAVHGGWVLAVLAVDADHVAAVGGDHVTLVDLRSGGTSRIDLEPGLHATSAVAVDGTHLAVAAPDGRVQVVAVHPGPGPDTGSLAGTLTPLEARGAGTFQAVDRPGA